MDAFKNMKTIKPAFWLANAQEACERLAYFGIRAILPLMMVSVGTGGLGLDMAQKGIIYGVWAFIQCIIPMVSGGFAESFGYKKSLIVAFIINTCGYLLMANILNVATIISGSTEINTTINFILMFIAGCTIGVGTAIFKPPVQGIVARSLNKKNSGFGFGLFYWVVNIGGFLAPMAASALRGSSEAPTWHYVFYGAAFVTLFNLLITLLFFKEPNHAVDDESKEAIDVENASSDDKAEIPSNEATEAKLANADAKPSETETKTPVSQDNVHKSAWQVLTETLGTLWHDKMILVFLLIVSGFWLMFMQLWDLLPNFIDEWVDRRGVGNFLAQAGIFNSFLEADGSLKPEMIINIDSAAIILFVLPLSAFFSRYKMMTSLILGMTLSVIGFVMSGLTMSGSVVCLAIFIFAIGEIICSPKFNEYIGMTAPKDKKAIYMGFSNIPFAIGWGLGNIISGPLYKVLSSKTTLATKFLVENGANKASLEDKPITDLMPMVQEVLEKQNGTAYDPYQATQVLWEMYSPWTIWLILGAIGLLSMIGMFYFYFKSGMASKDNANDNANDEVKKEAVQEEALAS